MAKALFNISKPKPADDSNAKISELIKRRRRQILVHSYLYYELNQNLISDDQWSKWALELEDLQQRYPKIAANTEYAKEFSDFDHSTGQNLRKTYMKSNIQIIAETLLQYERAI